MKQSIVIALLLMHLTHAYATSNFLEDSLAAKMGTREVISLQGSQVEYGATDPFFKNHALVFFFSSQCPYCQQFAPVIKEWSTQRHAPLLALSFDNQPVAGIPEFMPVTTGWINDAYAGRPITYPAVFIVNQTSHLLYPVAYGAMSSLELEQRLTEIKAKIDAYETRSSSL